MLGRLPRVASTWPRHRRADRREIAVEARALFVALEGAVGVDRAGAGPGATGRDRQEPARILRLQRKAREVEAEILAERQRAGGLQRGAQQSGGSVVQRHRVHRAGHAAAGRRRADLAVDEFRQAGVVDHLVGIGHRGVEGEVEARRGAEIGHRALDVHLGAQQVGDLDGVELQEVALHREVALDAAQRFLAEHQLGDLGLEPEHRQGLVGRRWRRRDERCRLARGRRGGDAGRRVGGRHDRRGGPLGRHIGVEVEAIELQRRRRRQGHREGDAAAARRLLAVEIDRESGDLQAAGRRGELALEIELLQLVGRHARHVDAEPGERVAELRAGQADLAAGLHGAGRRRCRSRRGLGRRRSGCGGAA